MGGFLTFRDLSHLSWTSGEVVDTLTDAAELFIFVFSPEQRTLLAWSRNAMEVLGVKDVEIARDGNIFLRHTHGDDRYQLLNTLEQSFEHNKSLRFVYRWLRPDTEELRWLLCRAEPVERSEGIMYEGIIGDITDEIHQFGGAPQFGPALFEALNCWVAVLDPDHRIVYRHAPATFAAFDFGDPGFNQEYAVSGKILTEAFSDSANGMAIRELIRDTSAADEQRPPLRLVWKERAVQLEVYQSPAKSGVSSTVIVVRDCTELARLEQERAQGNRAENFVQLASGVFHNVNNSLQTILGYAATMRQHAENPEVIRASCESITQLVEGAAGLTHQALAFRDSLLESQVRLDLNVAVMEALNRIQDLLSTGTKIAVSLGTVPRISASFHLLVESLEAILRAVHSTLGDAAGLSVQTAVTEVIPNSDDGVPAGSYSKLTISVSMGGASARRSLSEHSGVGNPSHRQLDALSDLFPNCGAIMRRERSGSGSETILMYFPLGEPLSLPVQESTSAPLILVIDDDRMVLETISTLLRDSGFPCIAAESKKDAITAFKRHRETVRLVILDAILPTGHGSSILRRLRKLKSDISVIGFSGASAPDLQALVDAGASHVLRKPVNPAKLLSLVRETLAKQEAA